MENHNVNLPNQNTHWVFIHHKADHVQLMHINHKALGT